MIHTMPVPNFVQPCHRLIRPYEPVRGVDKHRLQRTLLRRCIRKHDCSDSLYLLVGAVVLFSKATPLC